MSLCSIVTTSLLVVAIVQPGLEIHTELVVLIALDCDDAFETPGENLEPAADLERAPLIAGPTEGPHRIVRPSSWRALRLTSRGRR